MLAVLVEEDAILTLLVVSVGLPAFGVGSGEGHLRGAGHACGGGIEAFSSTSRRVMNGVMAALMTAVIIATVGCSDSGPKCAVVVVCWVFPLPFAPGWGSPKGIKGRGVAFFGHSDGEGSCQGVDTEAEVAG